MARMMPAYCAESAPPGEKALYSVLNSDNATSDWIVLHSLGIANHVRQVEGEADFVVIIPNTGILVVEVKSHLSVEKLPDGRWKLGRDAPKVRGPFQQASEAMYSIRDFLKKKGMDLGSTPMISAVWFTHVRARTMLPPSPEWHDWQVLDSEDLRNNPIFALRRTLVEGTKHLAKKNSLFSFGPFGPEVASAKKIASLLRPQFEAAVVAGDVRRNQQAQLVTLLEEQYLALDQMSRNHSVLFNGPAGSGKTLLAMEAAKREIAKGKRGRLLCFNRFLGMKLKSDMANIDGLEVGTVHQELLRISNVKVPAGAGPDFWEREIPERALDVLIEQPELASDFLIVDEIQDIAKEQFLDVLEFLVEGGLEKGRILLFGDFEHQAIFDSADGRELLKLRIPHLADSLLVTNCRNLPRIGYQVNLLSKLEPGYQRFRRQDDGIEPDFVLYKTGFDQSQMLIQSITALRDEGYNLDEIVVLSPLRGSSTAETTTDTWLRQVLHPAEGKPARPGQLLHCTIHAYKGLEARAVIVTDLDHRFVPEFESLLYVGMTRATDRLISFIETETLRKSVGRKP